MANVEKIRFKRGSQANLPTGNNIIDGAFYLTTDTGRLYVGQDNSGTKALVELNKSITLITKIQPTTGKTGGYVVETANGAYRDVESGEFYYHAGSNILMIGNDDGSLTQVNADNNTYIQSVSSTVGKTGNVYSASHTLMSNSGSNFDLTTNFIAGDGIALTQPSNQPNCIQIAADTDVSVNSIGTNGVSATIKVNDASLTLKSNANNGIKFSKDGNDLKLELPDSVTVPEYTLTHGGSNNHEVITLQKDGSGTPISLGDVKVTYDGTGTNSTSTYNSTNNVHELKLNVYTKNEVDTKFSTIASAMDYRGAVSRVPQTGDGSGSNGALVAGDMWKASIAITDIPTGPNNATKSAKTGDLIIRNSDGYFDIIPSGDDQNINVDASANEFKIQDGGNIIGKIALDSQSADSSAISFSNSTVDGTSTTGLTIKANLKQLTSTPPTGTYENINSAASGTVDLAASNDVLTGLSVDNYGRVTGYTKAKYTIPAAQTLTLTGGTVNNVNTLTITLSGDNVDHKITSNTLTIGGSQNNATIELMWDSFD